MPEKPMFFSKRYYETCSAISRAIAAWFDVHPGADPQFHWPPPKVVITGDLVLGLTWWKPNADARDLVTYVDQVTKEAGSMLQFQVCYQQFQQRRRPTA